MTPRKRDLVRSYPRVNEKRKINAAKENAIKRVSAATNKFIVKKNSAEIVESDNESLST